ncbi:MAG: hypothetical protein E6G83_20430 [Alphaproteobacteria bacterium]|nr:MAG: hypothetical protein E6G83_20430 [Alphaproteobacteria bacterium]
MPAAALAAVAASHMTGPVLNDYGFGGYLIFSGTPPFIDGRAELYGDEFIKRYIHAMLLESDELPKLLDQYGIAWTLIAPERPAALLLEHLPGWRRLYADDVAVVHVRTDPAAADRGQLLPPRHSDACLVGALNAGRRGRPRCAGTGD